MSNVAPPTAETTSTVPGEVRDPRLQLRSVSKTFGGTRVLKDVSLDVAAGEVHALVGQNGSGKSTIIKVLAGFHQPDPGGQAIVDGVECTLGDADAVRNAGVRFVHQDLGLVPALSVADNLALGHGYTTTFGARIDWRGQRAAAEKALMAVGYEMDVRRLVQDLQPVERTAVAIARALQSADGPMSVLVLDEPTATMPKAEVERFAAMVDNVRRQGVGILYVSHHLEEVFALADRVTVLVDGVRVATSVCADLDERSLIDLMTGGVVDSARRRAVHEPGPQVLTLKGVAGEELAPLDLVVTAGEIVGVAGITGSGREELCSLVFGARPRRGRVEVQGAELAPLRPDRSVAMSMAMVPAHRLRDGVALNLSVRENANLATVGRLARRFTVRSFDDRRQATTIKQKMAVKASSIEAPIESLSGGNQQKVVLGRWLQAEPQVLLLDEPTQGVDVGAKADIHQLIDAAADNGMAVLVCSSDEAELERLCDRVVVLRHGQVVAELTGEDITTSRLVQLSLGLTA